MREMINKIKQNILPILTVIMVLLSALCVVFILKPSQNQAQASIGTQYESVSGDGLTVYIGTYKYRWGTTKNGDGKTYAKAVSGAVGYNMPDYMYITGDGFTAPCFCITPSVDNGGRHTLSNITITPYTGAAAGIAKAAGNFSYRSYPTFCAIQTAVRQTVGGGSLSSTDRLFDYSGSSKKVISACMPYMVDTFPCVRYKMFHPQRCLILFQVLICSKYLQMIKAFYQQELLCHLYPVAKSIGLPLANLS